MAEDDSTSYLPSSSYGGGGGGGSMMRSGGAPTFSMTSPIREYQKTANTTFVMNGSNDSASWKDLLQSVDRARKTLPWASHEVVKAEKISMFDRKTKEREVDPLTMTYRDAEKESKHKEARMDRTHNNVLQRYDELKKNTFNFVSHEGPPRKMDVAAKEKPAPPPREWNMFSHLQHNDHLTCPTLYDEKYMRTKVRPKTTQHNTLGKQRDFSIISNQFNNDHDGKMRQEYLRLKEDVVKKYWETHQFDVLRCEYYADEAEERYVEEREAKKLLHGQEQWNRKPPSEKNSQGNSYNILNHEVRDAEKMRIAMSTQDRAKNRLEKFQGLPTMQVERGIKQYDLEDARRMNRISFKRWEAQIDRGYDFVNTTLTNVNPLPTRPATVWSRVHSSVLPNTDVLSSTLPGPNRQDKKPVPTPPSSASMMISTRIPQNLARGSTSSASFNSSSARGNNNNNNGVESSFLASTIPMPASAPAAANHQPSLAASMPASRVPSLDLTKAGVRTGGLSGIALSAH